MSTDPRREATRSAEAELPAAPAGAPQAVSTSTLPEPCWSESWWKARDGVRLLVRQRSSQAPNSTALPRSTSLPTARGTLLFLHGGGDHGGRYGHVIEHFAAHGWTCLVPDLRGHGRSEGPRYQVDSLDRYLDDLQDLQAALCPNGVADVVVGNSFGGLVATRLAERGPQPRALVLVAPLLGLSLHVPWWKHVIGHGLVRIWPSLRLPTDLDTNNMTSDPEFLARRRADPLIQKTVTIQWYFAMRSAMAAAHRDAGRITGPILALQGLADRTVTPERTRALLEAVASEERELMELPGQLHELLNQREWLPVVTTITDWLDRVLAPVR